MFIHIYNRFYFIRDRETIACMHVYVRVASS